MLIYGRFANDTNDRGSTPGVGPLDQFTIGFQWAGHVVQNHQSHSGERDGDGRKAKGIRERALRARIEAYNIFNHSEFNAMGTTMTLSGATNLSTTYGQYTATSPAGVVSTTLRIEF